MLPADTKIRFVITADDVIHAWWVPALGWKQDAIPGIVNEAWTDISKPGIYRGQCAELCGKDHGFMPIVVKAVSKAEFTSSGWPRRRPKNAPRPAAAPRRRAAPAAPAEAAPGAAPSRARPPSPPPADRRAALIAPRPPFPSVRHVHALLRCSAMAHPRTPHHDDDHGHQQGFVERWFFSTNHKDIGTLYLIFSFVMFIIGAAMSVVIRAELAQPGLQFVKPEFFNQMTTMHALVMIFGGVMPAFVGLANWMIPLQIGAPDMALPRMNNWSFWILPFAFTLLLIDAVPAGRRAGRRLDAVPAAVAAGRQQRRLRDLRHPHDGHQLDHGRDQHHRHHPQHARPGHGPAEDADLRAGPG